MRSPPDGGAPAVPPAFPQGTPGAAASPVRPTGGGMGAVTIPPVGSPPVGGIVEPRPRPRRRALRVGLVSACAVLAVPPAVAGGCWGWVRATTAGSVRPAAQAPVRPVAVVFGAAVHPDHTPSPFLAGRLDTAAELYRAGRVSVVLVSGDNRARNYDEPTAMRDYLLRAGLPSAAVVRDFAGFDTYATCVRARDVFGIRSAVLVTQGYHLPRALRTCASVGVDAVGVGSAVGRGTPTWTRGARREVLADVKAVWQLLTRPSPTYDGPPDSAVTDALAAAPGGRV